MAIFNSKLLNYQRVFPRHLRPHGPHLLQLCCRSTPSEPRRTSEQCSAGALAAWKAHGKTLGNTSISWENDWTWWEMNENPGFYRENVECQRFEHVWTGKCRNVTVLNQNIREDHWKFTHPNNKTEDTWSMIRHQCMSWHSNTTINSDEIWQRTLPCFNP